MLRELSQVDGVAVIEARVVDANGVPCLDAADLLTFGVTGDGRLLDNLGTAGGSRRVQAANGRAQISIKLTGSAAVASVAIGGLDTVFLNLKKLP